MSHSPTHTRPRDNAPSPPHQKKNDQKDSIPAFTVDSEIANDETDARNLETLGIENTQLIITEQYENLPKHPLETIWGKVFYGSFEYLTPLLIKGFRRPLQSADIWRLPHSDEAESLITKFNDKYQKHAHKKRPALWALADMFWKKFLVASIMKVWFDVCNLIIPIFLRYLLVFIERVNDPNSDSPWWEGALWILAMMFCQANAIFFTQQYFMIVMRIGMNIRSILSVAVFRKSLKLTTSVRSRMTIGKITNLMSVDCQKVADIMNFLAMLFSGPLQIIFCLAALSTLLYWPTIAGIIIMVVLIPVQMFIFGKYAKLRAQSLKFTDSRLKSLNEVLQGIRVIKFFTYESEYSEKIRGIRRNEIIKIGKMNLARSFVGTLMAASPVMVSVTTFGIYALAYPDRLTAQLIFPALSYMLLLRFPMVIFPMIISSTVDANISLNRIDKFFKEEERTPIEITHTTESEEYPVQFNDCEFEWDAVEEEEKKNDAPKKKKFLCIPLPSKKKQSAGPKEEKEEEPKTKESSAQAGDTPLLPDTERKGSETVISIDEQSEDKAQIEKDTSISKLSDINLKIKKGELVAIIGTVGSGKSSLLNGLVGEMKQTKGEVVIGSSLSYAPQTPWIMNATIRDNILFYKKYNEQRLNDIIDVCALGPDIEIFDNGLLSIIGEKGINLSGGQKARINIARACYADSDIVALDDVLSAVDSHTSKHIFEKCIQKHLKSKTRLLVTHHIDLCERCDRIVVMHEGCIDEVGTYSELMARETSRFKSLAEKYLSKKEGNEEQKEEQTTTKKEKKAPQEAKDIMRKDERVTGTVSLKVLWAYTMKMGGPFVVLSVLSLFIIAQLGLVSSDWWIGEWSNNTFPSVNGNAYISLAIYAGLGIFAAIMTFARDGTFYIVGLLASYRMHNDALKRLMRAPSFFFDTTPLGSILSRLSKDVEQADSQLIVVLSSFLGTFFQVLSAIGMVAYVTRGVYLILVVIILPFYLLTQQLYRRTSRELKRLDSISRSPLYSHFSETLNGISTIRAYKKEAQFQRVNTDRMDYNQRPFFTQLISQRWLAFRLEGFGALLVTGAAISVLGLSYVNWFDVSASRAGLGVVYSLTLTNVLSWCVRQLTEAETQFNAVERLIYYAKELPNERNAIEKKRPPHDWPQGRIELDNYQMRYREGLPLVLKGVNLNINAKEKVGVVGRTGSGKSSLLLALFRMVEPAGGRILIDGLDVSEIGLNDLRENLSIIPQDAVLFSGTIRSNIDPFHRRTDEEIWDALEKSSMKETIEKVGGLQTPVAESGENFSVGQRQLLCLARALLKKTNILLVDEASASLDLQSDAILQQTIREVFKDVTVITIAHRLLTIADSDKILVMDDGVAAEFDSPANLLKDESSIFYSLVSQTGSTKEKIHRVILEGEALNIEDVDLKEEKD